MAFTKLRIVSGSEPDLDHEMKPNADEFFVRANSITDMKKKESQKINTALKNECDFRSRSQSPKAYLGCHTCRLKNIKSNSKCHDYGIDREKIKLKKPTLEKSERELKSQKIKLTDLCDEDKKRIVELIEELSKLAEKNQQLTEKLDEIQKEKQEQQDYLLKQTKLFSEEKNFYLNEINEYKSRLEILENEMRNKFFQWENHGRFRDNELVNLAKTLQKLLSEKKELNEQMNHLKICLKHSLESFQKLRVEVSELQRQELPLNKYKSRFCQTENTANAPKEKCKHSDEETEEEFFSSSNQDTVNTKSNLSIINDKLEHVYQLLKTKRENMSNASQQKYDIDLSVLVKNDTLEKKKETEDGNQKNKAQSMSSDEPLKAENEENEDKLLKPYEQCNKTLVQAERILKKIGQPLNLNPNDCPQTLEMNNFNEYILKESSRNPVKSSNFLQNNIVQKNNLFKSSSDHQFDEDRLLEELFYSDQILNLGLNSMLKFENTKTNQNCAFTF